MGRIVAIDYGLKRTGLAWTDPLQIIASAVGTVETGSLMAELKRIVAEEEVERFLLGWPTRMDGSDTHTTEPVRRFRKNLEKQFPQIPIEMWDERYTTVIAKRALIEGGVKKKKRRDKALLDQVAATVMLQEYLTAH